jgi:hypothetical protein
MSDIDHLKTGSDADRSNARTCDQPARPGHVGFRHSTASRSDLPFQSGGGFSRAILHTIRPATDLECQMVCAVHNAFDHCVDLFAGQLFFGLITKASTNAKTTLRFSRIKFSASTSA